MSATTDLQQRSDSPMAIRHIAFELDNSNAEESARQLVYQLCPEWKESEGPIQLTTFTDGITNTLMKATKKRPGKSKSQIDREAILIRAYGKGTDVLIDRERELSAHSLLASRGLAPALLARFDNGLMYRFIEGDACSPEDLRRPEIYRQVAKRLGEWHGSLPISVLAHSGTSEAKARPVPNMWTVIQSWLEALPRGTDAEKQKVDILQKELDWLEGKLSGTSGLDGQDFIFSHCDLLSGNVIVEPTPEHNGESNGVPAERPVSFIDYEYSTPAPAAFDISNHFAEWAGFECDYSGVPTKSQRREFLQQYVASYRLHSITEDTKTLEIDFEADIDKLYRQIDTWRGVPGFYWGIWALIQSMISMIDFDYANYAEVRLGEYWAWKAELDGSRLRDGKEMPLRERRWAEA